MLLERVRAQDNIFFLQLTTRINSLSKQRIHDNQRWIDSIHDLLAATIDCHVLLTRPRRQSPNQHVTVRLDGRVVAQAMQLERVRRVKAATLLQSLTHREARDDMERGCTDRLTSRRQKGSGTYIQLRHGITKRLERGDMHVVCGLMKQLVSDGQTEGGLAQLTVGEEEDSRAHEFER